MQTAQFPPGEMLDDKYRIDRLLSVGGMGAIYIATHTLLKKRVAVKVLRTELAGESAMVERFQREAVAASAIGHENIVTVTDMGKTRGGVAFLVMELLDGRNLAVAIRDDGPFPVAVACDIAREMLAGVAAAHAAGIVHRDLKPENVFLVARPGRGESVKILDFGVSSLANAEKLQPRLTITGMVMGTPSFMAPEQARGDREITGAADIYSTAVILYEMLTDALPYEAENYNLLMHRVLSGEHVKLCLRRPDVPAALEAIVSRAMALDPRARFAQAVDFAEALAPFGSGGSGGAVVRIPTGQRKFAIVAGADAADGTSDTVSASSSESPASTSPPRRRAWKRALVAAGAAVVAAGVAMWAASPRSPRATDGAGVRPATPAAVAEPARDLSARAAGVGDAKAVMSPIVVEFAATPADAVVTVDGAAIPGGKLELPAPSARALAVHAEASGYEPFDGQVVADRSKTIVLPPLARVRQDSRRGAAAPASRRAPSRSARPATTGTDRIVTDDPYAR